MLLYILALCTYIRLFIHISIQYLTSIVLVCIVTSVLMVVVVIIGIVEFKLCYIIILLLG